jgi:hypothetical protein
MLQDVAYMWQNVALEALEACDEDADDTGIGDIALLASAPLRDAAESLMSTP